MEQMRSEGYSPLKERLQCWAREVTDNCISDPDYRREEYHVNNSMTLEELQEWHDHAEMERR